MRKTSLLCLLLFISLNLYSISLSSGSGRRFLIEDDSFAFSIDYGKASLMYHGVSFGQIDRIGLLRMLTDPYTGEMNVMPYASRWTESGVHSGTVARINNASFMVSSSDRKGFGISISFPFIDTSVLFMAPGKAENGYIDYSGISYTSIYSVTLLSFSSIKLLFAASVSSMNRIRLLGGVLFEISGYSIGIRIGQLDKLYSVSEHEYGSLALKIKRSIYSMDFSYVMGLPAVYSYEYQNWNVRSVQRLKLEKAAVEFMLTAKHDRKGMESREIKMEVKSAYFSFICSDMVLSSFRISLRNAEFMLSDGKYSVKLKKVYRLEHVQFEVAASTYNGIEIRIQAGF